MMLKDKIEVEEKKEKREIFQLRRSRYLRIRRIDDDKIELRGVPEDSPSIYNPIRVDRVVLENCKHVFLIIDEYYFGLIGLPAILRYVEKVEYTRKEESLDIYINYKWMKEEEEW